MSFRVPQKRSLEKCDECRRKKIKCLPEQRDFTLGVKCLECEKSGAPCGFNVRVRKPAQTPSNAGTPAQGILSPGESHAGSIELTRSFESSEAVEQQSQCTSSSRVLEAFQNDSTSKQSSFETAQPYVRDDAFRQALLQLGTMGLLVDLYAYSCQRSAAVAQMKDAWPLKILHDFEAALEFFTLVVGNQILTAFRHVVQLRLQVPPPLRELLGRRLVDTGRHYIAWTKGEGAISNQSSNFSKELQAIQNELVATYLQKRDYSEANRLRAPITRTCGWLSDYTLEMMSTLANALTDAIKIAFNDMSESFRKSLDAKGRLKFSAGCLAVLSDRQRNNIDAAACSLDSAIDITGRNILHLAVESSDIKFLRWALDSAGQEVKVMLEQRDTFGLTPLMIAAYIGCLDTFRLLVAKGANLKAQDPQGKSILCLASMAGHERIVSDILAKGIKIQDVIDYCSPIHDAAAAGRAEVVQLLINNKAEPREERREYNDKCASKVALKYGHTSIAKVLLQIENTLEELQPTGQIDPLGHQIRSLKRQVADAMARSRSPESPASTHTSVGTPQHVRDDHATRKRHKSLGQGQRSSPLTASIMPSLSRDRYNSSPIMSLTAENLALPMYSPVAALGTSIIDGQLLPEYNMDDSDFFTFALQDHADSNNCS